MMNNKFSTMTNIQKDRFALTNIGVPQYYSTQCSFTNIK